MAELLINISDSEPSLTQCLPSLLAPRVCDDKLKVAGLSLSDFPSSVTVEHTKWSVYILVTVVLTGLGRRERERERE